MEKNRILLSIGLLCLAGVVGWHLRGALDRLGGTGTPTRSGQDLTKAENSRNRPAAEAAERRDFEGSGAISAVATQGDARAGEESVGAAPDPESPQPAETVSLSTRERLGDEVEFSADQMTLRAVRPRPDKTPPQNPAVAVMPPDMGPEDVQVSPETGEIRVLRKQPEPPQAQPPLAVVPPDRRDRIVVSSPDAVLIRLLPPDKKAPDNPSATKPPER